MESLWSNFLWRALYVACTSTDAHVLHLEAFPPVEVAAPPSSVVVPSPTTAPPPAAAHVAAVATSRPPLSSVGSPQPPVESSPFSVFGNRFSASAFQDTAASGARHLPPVNAPHVPPSSSAAGSAAATATVTVATGTAAGVGAAGTAAGGDTASAAPSTAATPATVSSPGSITPVTSAAAVARAMAASAAEASPARPPTPVASSAVTSPPLRTWPALSASTSKAVARYERQASMVTFRFSLVGEKSLSMSVEVCAVVLPACTRVREGGSCGVTVMSMRRGVAG